MKPPRRWKSDPAAAAAKEAEAKRKREEARKYLEQHGCGPASEASKSLTTGGIGVDNTMDFYRQAQAKKQDVDDTPKPTPLPTRMLVPRPPPKKEQDPLVKGWEVMRDGLDFFRQSATGCAIVSPPREAHSAGFGVGLEHHEEYRLPVGWKVLKDFASDKLYYWNTKTREVAWQRPEEVVVEAETEEVAVTTETEEVAVKTETAGMDVDPENPPVKEEGGAQVKQEAPSSETVATPTTQEGVVPTMEEGAARFLQVGATPTTQPNAAPIATPPTLPQTPSTNAAPSNSIKSEDLANQVKKEVPAIVSVSLSGAANKKKKKKRRIA